TPIVAMAIRTFDLGNGVAAAHEELARGSPLFVALSTPMDNNEGWLAAGLGLQRLLLVATSEGYSTSYLNQPIEVADLRSELAKELSIDRYPQLLLRLGRGRPVSHSPRRPISDVLIGQQKLYACRILSFKNRLLQGWLAGVASGCVFKKWCSTCNSIRTFSLSRAACALRTSSRIMSRTLSLPCS